MANNKTRIEREGLQDYVVELYAQGIVTGTAVAQKLKEEKDFDISPSSVRKYLAKLKPQFEKAASKKIQDHVDQVVPQDLNTLEEMEAQCIEWFRELPSEQAERLASAALEINGELDRWIEMLTSLGAKKRADVIQDIIRRVIHLVNRDARLQDKRIKAMKMVLDIIALKIGKARELDDDQKGKIILVDRSSDYVPPDPDSGEGRKPMRVVMGGKDGGS
ncbi:hypothetical protein [Desulfatibacillum aliphaticivorans]|uniref:hypothetical protein n=1 Tax=Desulfatibacillum aliphaticivorans TaxID=218208 RepID=UPI00047F216E|nr:hypothetical protein [Desulfatibacillum aliphaticivorans]